MDDQVLRDVINQKSPEDCTALENNQREVLKISIKKPSDILQAVQNIMQSY